MQENIQIKLLFRTSGPQTCGVPFAQIVWALLNPDMPPLVPTWLGWKGKDSSILDSDPGPGQCRLVHHASDRSHIPNISRPLLSARPAVTFPAAEHQRPLAGNKLYCLVPANGRWCSAAGNETAWWQLRARGCVNDLPRVAARQAAGSRHYVTEPLTSPTWRSITTTQLLYGSVFLGINDALVYTYVCYRWIENQKQLTNITADDLRIYPSLTHLLVLGLFFSHIIFTYHFCRHDQFCLLMYIWRCNFIAEFSDFSTSDRIDKMNSWNPKLFRVSGFLHLKLLISSGLMWPQKASHRNVHIPSARLVYRKTFPVCWGPDNWNSAVLVLAPPTLETSGICHDSSVCYRHIHGSATDIVEIRCIGVMVHFRYYKKRSCFRLALNRRCFDPGQTERTSVFCVTTNTCQIDRSTFWKMSDPITCFGLTVEDAHVYWAWPSINVTYLHPYSKSLSQGSSKNSGLSSDSS